MRPRRAWQVALLVAALVGTPGAWAADDEDEPPPDELRGLAQKSFLVVGERAGSVDLESAEDRDWIRTEANRETVRFANAFVRDVKSGKFTEEIDAVVEINGGGESKDKLLGFLDSLEEIEDVDSLEGVLDPGNKQKLRKMQLAWTLVQLVRYGAPGFRAPYDKGGTPGAFDEFAEEAEGDGAFLQRLKAFEDEYERYVEVGRGSEPIEKPDDEEIIQTLVDSLTAMLGAADLANPPDADALRSFATAILDTHLTRADQVWSIKASWHEFSGSTGEVRSKADAAFMASGAQALSWSLPRMNLGGDPMDARDEIGKAYSISFTAKGWLAPGPNAAAFAGAWNPPNGNGMSFTRDEAAWPVCDPADPAYDPGCPGYSQWKILEKIEVKAEGEDMQMIDRSLELAGQSASGGPDILDVAEVVKVHWKRLDAFPDAPKNIQDIPTTVSSPSPPKDPEEPTTFDLSGGGGSFP